MPRKKLLFLVQVMVFQSHFKCCLQWFLLPEMTFMSMPKITFMPWELLSSGRKAMRYEKCSRIREKIKNFFRHSSESWQSLENFKFIIIRSALSSVMHTFARSALPPYASPWPWRGLCDTSDSAHRYQFCSDASVHQYFCLQTKVSGKILLLYTNCIRWE